MDNKEVIIIGGGLAGVEAAWQVLKKGFKATIFEMKPKRFSPAHSMPRLAEIVCSNSLKSMRLDTASGLLKEEMKRFDSLVLKCAELSSVPAGSALAVDKEIFSKLIEEHLQKAGVNIVRDEVSEIPTGKPLIIATGP